MHTDTINISISKTENSRINDVDFSNLPFGHIKSDHMFVAKYRDGEWKDFEIKAFQNLDLSPASIALHYGQSIFEGMKAFRNENDEIALFRPEKNMERLQLSAERMCMPPVPKEVFMEGLKQLIDIDRDWVPKGKDNSLYIRPFQFGDEPNIGVHASNSYQFIIFTCPSGKYYSKDVEVFVAEDYIRAARGGAGFAKAAGNYGPTLLPAQKCKELGYDQILWTQQLNGKRYVQEIGTMNFFVQIDDTLITPELDGTILEGITRNSIITLAKEKGIKVEERQLSVDELFEAAHQGRVKDAFGSGTAAVITQIIGIGRRGDKVELPKVQDRQLSNFFYNQLHAIRNGEIEDTQNWMLKI